jgi:phosphatidylinositol alpha-1,6-mannosyltransferase
VAAYIRQASVRAGVSHVHCGRLLPEGLSASLAALTGAPRYTCWAHGEELSCMGSSRELRLLASHVCRHATMMLANSRNTALLLKKYGASDDKIRVVHPGVDGERFRPHADGSTGVRRSWGAWRTVLLTVGRLQRRKGHDLVVETLTRLGQAASDVLYVIVGEGDERPRLERLVRDRGLSSRVLFAGAVPASQLPAYYAAADIFVHPNRVDGVDLEGFGIVFLEAAASGLPVIAGRSGGVPEAVADGETGLLVGGADVAELECAIARLTDSPSLRRTLGEAGRRRVLRDFTWQRAADLVRDIHSECGHLR